MVSGCIEQECDLAPLLQVVLVFVMDANLVISKVLACQVTASRWPLMVSVGLHMIWGGTLEYSEKITDQMEI